MKITKKQQKDMENIIRPLIKWMNLNLNPHTKIIVTNNSIELLEGVSGTIINDYIVD